MGIFIVIIIFVIIFIIIKVIDEKIRAERRQLAWNKIRFIQKITPENKLKIFIKNNKRCASCGSTEKLLFHIDKDVVSEFKLSDVSIICSDCNGYSIGYDYNRKIPNHTKRLVFARDKGVLRKLW